ncbi:MAG: AraC family transcriptional regulator [Sphaerochaetaceae bacterium]|jgi:AraC-like DNA-binding protein|nr:AraC family transcriptional regulator [Sphaerochaetaceae bacterium]
MKGQTRVISFSHGLQASYSNEIDWSHFHQHSSEIEMAFHPVGPVTYLFGGREEAILQGETFLYWGAIPHRVIESMEGDTCYFLTIPVSLFVQMSLPASFVRQIFSGEIFKEKSPIMREIDLLFFHHSKGLAAGENDFLSRSVLYWVQYRLFRFLSNLEHPLDETESQYIPKVNPLQQETKTEYVKVKKDKTVEKMYKFITSNYLKQVAIQDVADHVNLNANYANTLFRESTGLSIGRFISMMRIYKSQSLLLTTDLKIIDVALDSGFQSLGNFYKSFQQQVGESPSQYRSRHMPKLEL